VVVHILNIEALADGNLVLRVEGGELSVLVEALAKKFRNDLLLFGVGQPFELTIVGEIGIRV